ncbi:peptidoglycan-binding domain-containing protein [Acuticoccus kandeliae]|uniref:peptidoglycan-binding domain-containing protein n=1 Tax=Acuticoccus kandeliae TaxID=2073160 RepID=UPI000D3EB432|nr:peptidoglycan-binding domain-containing protein [Acuticoccus kandeliae]
MPIALTSSRCLPAAFAALALLLASAPACAQAKNGDLNTWTLEEPTSGVKFAADGTLVLWSADTGHLFEIDPTTGVDPRPLTFEGSGAEKILDVLATRENSVYVLSRAEKAGDDFITRLARHDKPAIRIGIESVFGNASLAAGTEEGAEVLFVFSPSLSVVVTIRNPESYDGRRVSAADLKDSNVFLEDGPPSNLIPSADGELLTAYHQSRATISLTDARRSIQLQSRRLGNRAAGEPLEPTLVEAAALPGGGGGTGLLVVDLGRRFMFLMAVDPASRRLADLLSAGMTSRISTPGTVVGPTIARASDDLSVLAVGARGWDGVALFSLDGNAFAGPYLPSRLPKIAALDLSSDGSTLAYLWDGGTKVSIVRGPLEWARAADPVARTQTVEEVQRQLAALNMDPGLVDGLIGPQTRTAIDRFKSLAGVPRGASLEQTNLALRDVLAERSPSAPCEPLPEAARCAIDASATEGAPRPDTPRICRGPADAPRPVQVDYPSNGPEPAYHCTRFHTCGFIGTTFPLAFEAVCGPNRS